GLGRLLRGLGRSGVRVAGGVPVTAADLLLIYRRLLGPERYIMPIHIGLLLTVRSASALVARIFYARLIQTVGRLPLTLVSTLVGAGAFALMAVPSLPVMYAASIAVGIRLRLPATLPSSGVVLVAPPEPLAAALTLRITHK